MTSIATAVAKNTALGQKTKSSRTARSRQDGTILETPDGLAQAHVLKSKRKNKSTDNTPAQLAPALTARQESNG